MIDEKTKDKFYVDIKKFTKVNVHVSKHAISRFKERILIKNPKAKYNNSQIENIIRSIIVNAYKNRKLEIIDESERKFNLDGCTYILKVYERNVVAVGISVVTCWV